MKKKIRFLVSLGSKWPVDHAFLVQDRIFELPVGGTQENIEIEFETDNIDVLKDAFKALKEHLNRSDYHIWYWWWL